MEPCTPLFDCRRSLSIIRRRKVLASRDCSSCSSMTASGCCGSTDTHTSYNDNARHYTLVGVPQFDEEEHGLWAYRDVRFKAVGMAAETIVALVEHSSAGLTAQQLQQLLHIENLKPILTRLMQRKSLTRERINACFVYFALQRTARSGQHQQRKHNFEQSATHDALPALNDIVGLLVEVIRRPDKTPRRVGSPTGSEGLHAWGRTGKPVKTVLTHYGIDVKKGSRNPEVAFPPPLRAAGAVARGVPIAGRLCCGQRSRPVCALRGPALRRVRTSRHHRSV